MIIKLRTSVMQTEFSLHADSQWLTYFNVAVRSNGDQNVSIYQSQSQIISKLQNCQSAINGSTTGGSMVVLSYRKTTAEEYYYFFI